MTSCRHRAALSPGRFIALGTALAVEWAALTVMLAIVLWGHVG